MIELTHFGCKYAMEEEAMDFPGCRHNLTLYANVDTGFVFPLSS